MNSHRSSIWDEFDDDAEEFFRQEYVAILEEHRSKIVVEQEDKQDVGRIELKGIEVNVHYTQMEQTPMGQTLTHDYRQSKIVQSYADVHVLDSTAAFPREVPPYEPIYSGRRLENFDVRMINRRICKLLHHKPALDTEDPFMKDLDVSKDYTDQQLAVIDQGFLGFVDETTYVGDKLHWRFNPFSIRGARMVTTSEEDVNLYTGTYRYNQKSYRFKFYKQNSPYYEIYADEWYPRVTSPSSALEAFYLAKTTPYWRYKTQAHRQQLIPTHYVLVDIEKAMQQGPYGINRSLGRMIDNTTPSHISVGYMALGSGKLYTPQWVHAERIRTPIPTRMNIMKQGQYGYHRGNDGRYTRVVGGAKQLLYTPEDYIAPTTMFAVETIAGQYWEYTESRVYQKDLEVVYEVPMSTQTSKRYLRILVPIPNGLINKFGQVLLADGVPLSQWLYVKQLVSNYDAYRCYVATYGGPQYATQEEILQSLHFEDLEEEDIDLYSMLVESQVDDPGGN